MAQSSVTLYGVADAGVGKIKLNSPGGTGNDAHNKTEFLSGSSANTGNSRIGVRGTEDMGGGLKAGFNFESGLDLDDGSVLNGTMWGRQAHVWLSGSWGTLKLGRQYTPAFLALINYDLTANSTHSPALLAYSYVGIGSRANSAFAYISPNFNGLTVGGAYVTKTDLGLSKAAWDVTAMYADGSFNASLDVNKVANSKTNYLLGGQYRFGDFILAASYTQASTQTKAQRSGFEVGGTALFGPFSVTLDLTHDTKNEWGSKKYTNGLIRLQYNLSKRTFLYAVYLRMDGSYQGTGGITSYGSTNNYILGVRHNF